MLSDKWPWVWLITQMKDLSPSRQVRQDRNKNLASLRLRVFARELNHFPTKSHVRKFGLELRQRDLCQTFKQYESRGGSYGSSRAWRTVKLRFYTCSGPDTT